ncbi:protein ANTI-SILENCING 1 isoform X1 [Senna tora]|uniref:Protein ANTI-SILENCING 1 isoform X1 n=1 Tax=Senna tora TaxID=362788 RepID=A0A834SZY6_9FABA|nr:protein ANTI-SILENCING 1 isoform X1 [Senna tora]
MEKEKKRRKSQKLGDLTTKASLKGEVVSNICRYYAMSRPTKENVEDETDFKRDNNRGDGLKNKDVQFYESFTYKGVEYFLYDCVYFYQAGDFETSIGKLVRIFETPTHEKKKATALEEDEDLSAYSPIFESLPSTHGSPIKGDSLIEAKLNTLESSTNKIDGDIQELKEDFEHFKKTTKKQHKETMSMLSKSIKF